MLFNHNNKSVPTFNMQLRSGKTTAAVSSTKVNENKSATQTKSNDNNSFNRQDSYTIYLDELYLSNDAANIWFKGKTYKLNQVEYDHGCMVLTTDSFFVEVSNVHSEKYISVSIVEPTPQNRREEFDYSAIVYGSWEGLLNVLAKRYYLTTYPMKRIQAMNLTADRADIRFEDGEDVKFYHLGSDKFFGLKDIHGFHLVEDNWKALIYDIAFVY